MQDSLTELFCDIDDFCQPFIPDWERQQLASQERQRRWEGMLGLSEMMTILVYFHPSSYRFKHDYFCQHTLLKGAFPGLLSYRRFVYLMGRRGQQTGISFIDATSLVVCHPRRIHSHKVFKQVAQRGKTSTGWFYGFKLHRVINDRGE